MGLISFLRYMLSCYLVPNPYKDVKVSWCFSLRFFRDYATFLKKIFALTKRVPPSFVSIFCNRTEAKNPKGSTSYIFRHCDTIQTSHFLIFLNFFKVSKWYLPFFLIFHETGVSKSPKGPFFHNFKNFALFER